MSNRAERRRMMREQTGRSKKLVASYSKQQRIEALIKNGITTKDLEESYENGRLEGFKQAAIPIVKSCYAGICTALHDEFGFGTERCYRAIKAVDEKIIYALNHQELVDEVLQKVGLDIEFDAPFDRVVRTK